MEGPKVNGLIEIICENDKEVCDKVIKELNEKYESNCPFSVKQIWIKFKN